MSSGRYRRAACGDPLCSTCIAAEAMTPEAREGARRRALRKAKKAIDVARRLLELAETSLDEGMTED